MRYNKAAIKRDTTGSRYQASTIVPKIPLNSNDQYIECIPEEEENISISNENDV